MSPYFETEALATSGKRDRPVSLSIVRVVIIVGNSAVITDDGCARVLLASIISCKGRGKG